MTMELAQMQQIAADLSQLKSRITKLEERRMPATYAPTNTYVINNEGETVIGGPVELPCGTIFCDGGNLMWQPKNGEAVVIAARVNTGVIASGIAGSLANPSLGWRPPAGEGIQSIGAPLTMNGLTRWIINNGVETEEAIAKAAAGLLSEYRTQIGPAEYDGPVQVEFAVPTLLLYGAGGPFVYQEVEIIGYAAIKQGGKTTQINLREIDYGSLRLSGEEGALVREPFSMQLSLPSTTGIEDVTMAVSLQVYNHGNHELRLFLGEEDEGKITYANKAIVVSGGT